MARKQMTAKEKLSEQQKLDEILTRELVQHIIFLKAQIEAMVQMGREAFEEIDRTLEAIDALKIPTAKRKRAKSKTKKLNGNV